MKERRGVFGAGLAGAIALVALLSITAAGTAGTATTAAPAATAAPLVTAQNIRPPAVANARSIRARFGGTSLTFLGDGPVGKSHTRDVNLVLRSREGEPVPFRVFLDGAPPGARAASGEDIDDAGHGALVEPRLYQLIRQPGPIADRTFEITFAGAGVEAYVFTFG